MNGTAPIYATIFSSFGLLGLAGTTKKSRRRKIAAGFVLGLLLLAQIACGGLAPSASQTNSAATATATPAVTYTITVNAVSGSVAKSTVVSLTVN